MSTRQFDVKAKYGKSSDWTKPMRITSTDKLSAATQYAKIAGVSGHVVKGGVGLFVIHGEKGQAFQMRVLSV